MEGKNIGFLVLYRNTFTPVRSQLYEGLQKLLVIADKKCSELSYDLFSRHRCFYGFQKTKILSKRHAVGHTGQGQFLTDVACSLAFIIQSFHNHRNNSKRAKQLSENL